MSSRKTSEEKDHLVHMAKTNRRVPLWVMVKTNRKWSSNPKRKHWRRGDKGKEMLHKMAASKNITVKQVRKLGRGEKRGKKE